MRITNFLKRTRILLGLASVLGVVGWLGLAKTDAAGAFTPTGNMSVPRYIHTATLLPNGTVLVAGGGTSSTAESTAETYNPATGTFSVTGALTVARQEHTATLLNNGTVLLTGGTNNASGGSPLSTAETYDPVIGAFSPTSNDMSQPRLTDTATLLADGTVLVAGGANGELVSATADIYNPAARTFSTAAGAMTTPRYGHTATQLNDGTVLITGGNNGSTFLASAEIYNPVTKTFSGTVGTMLSPRADHTATLLSNGKVLITGGTVDGATALASAEIYDPITQTFSATGSMSVPRGYHSATALPDGTVLVTGGAEGCCFYLHSGTASADIYDPAAGAFSAAGNMTSPRVYHTSTLLGNGSVLITGGQSLGDTTNNVLGSAELFGPFGPSSPGITSALYVTGTGCGAATFSGGAYTDSFDSSVGDYAITRSNDHGDISVNGNARLSGNVAINGTIFAARPTVGDCKNGNGISISGNARATGGYAQLTPITFVTPGPFTAGSSEVDVHRNQALPPGTYGNIKVSGQAVLTLSPGVYNINSLVLSGASKLTISPSGAVTLNIAGAGMSKPVDLSGGSMGDPSGIPANLLLNYGGTGEIDLSGQADNYGILYAPNAAIDLSGHGDWFGAMVVKTLTDTGGSAIHYDRRLGQ
jgi:hypothetical protein